MREISIKARDGYYLAIKIYEAEKTEKIMQIIHGMEEYYARYEEFARFMAQNGITVVISNIRGHGLPGKKPVFFKEKDGYKELIWDQIFIRRFIRKEYGKKPVILLGHSMGSIIGRVLLQGYSDAYEKIVFTGSPVYNRFVYSGIVISKGMNKIFGPGHYSDFLEKITIGPFNLKIDNPDTPYDWICSDPKVLRDYDADEFCGNGFTSSALGDLYKLMALSHKSGNYHNIRKNLPMLFLWGIDDPCGGGEKGMVDTINTLYKAGFENITDKYYPAMRHEILNEFGKEVVWDDILNFIKEKTEKEKKPVKFKEGLSAIKSQKGYKSRGLVLEGGGMRGIYTAGVLDVFMEEGISFDGVIGVSAGAVHGCSFVSKQPERSINYYKEFCDDPDFMSVRSLIKSGDFVGKDLCYDKIPNEIYPFDYETFKNSDTRFFVCTSNIETGEGEYIEIKDMKEQMDAMRASASLPFISRVVNYDGKKLLDGGVVDSIPIRFFMKIGVKKNVIVLTRDENYVKTPVSPGIAKIWFRKYPKFIHAYASRHKKYNDTLKYIEKLEKKGKVFVIRPSRELTIGRLSHDARELQKTYETGREDAKKQLEALKKWLEEK